MGEGGFRKAHARGSVDPCLFALRCSDSCSCSPAVMAAGAAAMAATPAQILAAAPAGDWRGIDPDDLLLIDLANGRRVAIALAPAFAPAHVANIRAIAQAHWYDGLWVSRVQDDYVAQWGRSGRDEDAAGADRAKPAGGI